MGPFDSYRWVLPLLFIHLCWSSPFLIGLILPSLFFFFHSVNEPGSLTDCEQELVNQDLRREGDNPRHHAEFQSTCGHAELANMHVCAGTHSKRGGGQLSVLAGLTQLLVSEVASEMRQKELCSYSVLQMDGNSDFGELTTTLREDKVS